MLRHTLHRPGWIDKEGYAGQSVIVRQGILARREKTHHAYFVIGRMLLGKENVYTVYVSNFLEFKIKRMII